MKKAILIDVTNKTITEVEIEDGIQPIYEKLQCECFTTVDVDGRNTVYVDDEGLLKLTPDTKFFRWGEYQPLAGNGLILGYNPKNGKSVDVSISVEDVKKEVVFMGMREVQKYVYS